MASRKLPRPVTLNFFPDGEDLPIFSGALVAPAERPFVAETVARQPSLIDLRLDPFNTLDSSNRPPVSAAPADPARF